MNNPSSRRVSLQIGFRVVVFALVASALGLLLSNANDVNAKPATALGAWSLQFADEFNGSGALNGANWLYDTGHNYPGGAGNWGTGEIENMTTSTANVNQTGGHLAITPLRDGA